MTYCLDFYTTLFSHIPHCKFGKVDHCSEGWGAMEAFGVSCWCDQILYLIYYSHSSFWLWIWRRKTSSIIKPQKGITIGKRYDRAVVVDIDLRFFRKKNVWGLICLKVKGREGSRMIRSQTEWVNAWMMVNMRELGDITEKRWSYNLCFIICLFEKELFCN